MVLLIIFKIIFFAVYIKKRYYIFNIIFQSILAKSICISFISNTKFICLAKSELYNNNMNAKESISNIINYFKL